MLTRRLAARRYRLLHSLRSTGYRRFHDSRPLLSGHNRWSSIKHDKAKNDAAKNKQRSRFAQELTTASKFFGPDPNTNPRLADLITKAKKNGFAKDSIEAAIARGQGKSAKGDALELITSEAILPGNVGVVIDCETDNRARTLQNIRTVIKRHGGSTTPASYLFRKVGRIIFESKEGVDADTILETAVEAGALDVLEGPDDNVIVTSEPNETRAVGESISKAQDVQISSSEIVWVPNEDTAVPIQDAGMALRIRRFVEEVRAEDSTIQGIYMNVVQGEVDKRDWEDLREMLNV